MVRRLETGEARRRPTTPGCHPRGRALPRLSRRSGAPPTSVRWVTNQNRRWGRAARRGHHPAVHPPAVCRPYVLDYVLLHGWRICSPRAMTTHSGSLQGYPGWNGPARGYLGGLGGRRLAMSDDGDDLH